MHCMVTICVSVAHANEWHNVTDFVTMRRFVAGGTGVWGAILPHGNGMGVWWGGIGLARYMLLYRHGRRFRSPIT